MIICIINVYIGNQCYVILSSLYKNYIYLKLVSAIFYQIFIFHQMIGLRKLGKMFFLSSKKLFLFSRYSNFCIFVFPSFFHCQPLLEKLIQEQSNPRKKVYEVINCLSKNLITHFV